mgnify:CR=1 FL=1
MKINQQIFFEMTITTTTTTTTATTTKTTTMIIRKVISFRPVDMLTYSY